MLRRSNIISWLIGIAIVLVAVGTTLNQPAVGAGIDFEPEVKIPGLFDKTVPVNNDLIGRYLSAIYVYFIWTVGVLAVVMVTFAGVKWVAAAGDAARIKDARDMINSAIIGIVIGLTSVVLLNLISPQFTIFKLPDLRRVDPSQILGAAVTKVCPVATNTQCGVIQEIGKIKINPDTGRPDNVKGVEVNEYCIGTTCPRGGIVGLGEDIRVCSIDINQETGFYINARGCVNEFTYDPAGAPGELRNFSPLKVHQGYQSFGAIVAIRQKCGELIKNLEGRYEAGGWCSSAGVTLFSSANPQCYLLGSAGKMYDKIFPLIDVATNLCCPGAPCPSRDK